MPGFSAATRVSEGRAAYQFRDFRGKPYSTSGVMLTTATAADVLAAGNAIGALSNARLMESSAQINSVQQNPSNPANTAFDEAYATTDDQLILVFQNSVGDIQNWRIPAPDASYFLPDGETVIVPDGGAAAGTPELLLQTAIDALLTLMGGTYVYSRAFKSGVSRRARRPLPIEEPTGNPPAAPGV